MVIADWVNASYKIQSGDMNQAMHRGELEMAWYFTLDGNQRISEVRQLFEPLKRVGFPTT